MENPLAPFVEKGVVAGAVSAVADRTRTLSREAVGWADVDARTPLRPDALFWIASQTKSFTATLLMQAVDDGRVALDAPVARYLPEFSDLWVLAEESAARRVLRRPSRAPTVRDLLTHTSGLLHFLDIEDPGDPRFTVLPLAEATRLYVRMPLLSDPGARWRYANAGFATAGRVLEVVTGVDYHTLLRRRLLEPLGMRETTAAPDRRLRSRLAQAYRRGASGLERATIPLYRRQPLGTALPPFPAGELFSTASDLIRFGQSLLGGRRRVLSTGGVAEMRRKQVDFGIPDGSGYGLGWFVNRDGSFGHNGAFGTIFTVDPARERVYVLLIQHDGEIGADLYGTFLRDAKQRFG